MLVEGKWLKKLLFYFGKCTIMSHGLVLINPVTQQPSARNLTTQTCCCSGSINEGRGEDAFIDGSRLNLSAPFAIMGRLDMALTILKYPLFHRQTGFA